MGMCFGSVDGYGLIVCCDLVLGIGGCYWVGDVVVLFVFVFEVM